MSCSGYAVSSATAFKRLKITTATGSSSSVRRSLHALSLDIAKGLGVDLDKLEESAREMGIPVKSDERVITPEAQEILEDVRLPRAVQAAYLRPLRRQAEHGVPVCNLQLRSFNIPTLEFFADFAMRAAYFLKMPARGPVPLPRIHERWTVPRSNFVHKKSQENFERFTFRRLIQLQDGHADTVRIWLAYLQKHQYHGVGMKANVWEWEALHADADADAAEAAVRRSLQEKAKLFGRRKEARTLATAVELLETAPFRKTMGSVY